MPFVVFLVLNAFAHAQAGPEAMVTEVARAALHSFTTKVDSKLPRDQISVACGCARGSSVRLEDARGRLVAEQTISDAILIFTNVGTGPHDVIAEDRITKARLIVRGARGGDAVDLKP